MNKITELKGQNGKIIVYDLCVAISRDTFGGFMSQGGASGERKYFYKNINTIEFKKPSIMSNGYFKILTSGSDETNAKVGLFSSSKKSRKDQNTVILRAFTKSVGIEAEKIYELVMNKIIESKEDIPKNNVSKMDELKKLGELKASGILSEEEFQNEKRKLLDN